MLYIYKKKVTFFLLNSCTHIFNYPILIHEILINFKSSLSKLNLEFSSKKIHFLKCIVKFCSKNLTANRKKKERNLRNETIK